MLDKFKALSVPLLTSLIFITGCILLFLMFYPFDVLKHWSLSVPAGTYHVGDEVTAHTVVDKTKSLTAHAHRNIECKNSSGVFVSYHLADITGGSSKTGHISANIPFQIPPTIPDLPTTCRFSIAATYSLYSLREVNEYTASNNFMVTK